jgi:hypothetical protein
MVFLKNSLISCVLIYCLWGCEEDVKLDETYVENKLVVQSFISPQDTVLTVRVSETKPLIGTVSTENKWIANANVSVSEGQNTLLIPYEKMGFYKYRLISKIKVGTIYSLKVTTPDGRKVEAVCKIPEITIDSTDLKVKITQVVGSRNQMLIEWQDVPNQKNYYGIWFGFEKLTKGCSSGKTNFISDIGKDGRFLSYASNFDTICNQGESRIKLLFGVYDENYYNFLKTLSEQNDTNGVPFTESIQVFTNIKGGYGIFCSYNQITKFINY